LLLILTPCVLVGAANSTTIVGYQTLNAFFYSVLSAAGNNAYGFNIFSVPSSLTNDPVILSLSVALYHPNQQALPSGSYGMAVYKSVNSQTAPIGTLVASSSLTGPLAFTANAQPTWLNGTIHTFNVGNSPSLKRGDYFYLAFFNQQNVSAFACVTCSKALWISNTIGTAVPSSGANFAPYIFTSVGNVTFTMWATLSYVNGSAPTVHHVKVNGSKAFKPNNITIPLGDVVQFDVVTGTHSVTFTTHTSSTGHAKCGGTATPNIGHPTASAAPYTTTVTPTAKGTLYYYCTRHCSSKRMYGWIYVV